MDVVTYRVSLDVRRGGVQKVLSGFFSGDVLSRRVAISLVVGSTPCTFMQDAIGVMYVTKANGTENIGACTVDGGILYYDIRQTDTDAVGITRMQCKVISGGKVLYAPLFALEVQPVLGNDTEVEESPAYTILEETLMKAEKVYSGRLISVSIREDLVFTAEYADGTVYTSDAIKEAFANQNIMVDTSVLSGMIAEQNNRLDVAIRRQDESIAQMFLEVGEAEETRAAAEAVRAEAEEERIRAEERRGKEVEAAIEKAEFAAERANKAAETDSHKNDSTVHVTAEEKEVWNAAKEHAGSAHAPIDAERNAIMTIEVNGSVIPTDESRVVSIIVPTKVSELENDAGFGSGSSDTSPYSLPLATSSVLGGVKVGYTANGRNYPVQLSNEQMYVTVPWTDNDTTYDPATQSAAGLMSAADKKKLDGVAEGANAYTHQNSGVAAGTYRSVTVNAQGHVTGGSNPTLTVAQGGTGATTAEQALASIGAAAASHTHAASAIAAGTFSGQVVAPAGTDYTANRVRNAVFTTSDPGENAAVSYVDGSVIAVYE